MEKFINVKGFPLVFVQNAAGDSFTVYQDGKEVRGIRSIRIDAGVDEFTTHEIEYVTGATESEKDAELVATTLTGKDYSKSPNERRQEAIEKAKKFVEEIAVKSLTEFIVNEEKRTVVVLIRGSFSGKTRIKGIAKCAPSDVFNVHIGKAIALGRAYGLDVSEFEQAPQPTEPVLGMVVEVEGIFHPYVDPVISGSHYRNGIDALREYPERLIRIISDSEAKY